VRFVQVVCLVKSNKKPEKSNIIRIDSPAYDIAMLQLKYLRERAMNGLLSLDETRQYDILCKNLNLLNGDPTTIEARFKELESDYTEAQLVEAVTEPKQLEKTNDNGDSKKD